MEAENTHVCPPGAVRQFDNFLRPWIHSPKKLFREWVEPGMTVMDVGCGRGFASLGLAELVGPGGRVIAADLQPEMLDMVRERASRAGCADRITFHRCEATRIGASGPVDFVLAFYMVHEVPDPRAFLAEVFALLAPGGHLYVVEPPFHVSRRRFKRLARLAEEAGFRVAARPRVRLSRAVVLERPAG